MNRFSKLARRALGAASALTALAASPAAAQQIDRIVVFGDSYADQGNAFALGYSNPDALAIYPTGRFSGGVNYIDVLTNLLNVTPENVDNNAIGGALGGTNNNTLCFDPYYAPGTSPLCGKGFEYQVDNASVGTLDEHDLLAFSIGGNDARIYQIFGGPLATAGLAGAATAANVAAQLDRIIVNGTPTISYIAADAGRFPEIVTEPDPAAAAAIRSAYSAGFNTALQQNLAGYAAEGSIVHYLNSSLVLDSVIADPDAYGITNGLACPAPPNLTCLGNSTGYLFYLDGLHLTSQGMTILAQYVAAQVTAPLTLQAPADLGVDSGRAFGRTMSGRSSAARDVKAGLSVYALGDGFSRRVNSSRGNDAFQSKGWGVTLGAEYGFGGGMAGVAVNLTRPKADFDNDAAAVSSRSAQVGAYAGAGFGNGGFAQAYVGAGWDKHDIDRRGVVAGMSADADGSHFLMGGQAGFLMDMGAVSVGPVAGLDYVRAKVDGYTESGDAALTLDVGSQRYKSLRGSLGAEARFALGNGDTPPFHGYLGLLAEKELAGDHGNVTFFQTASPVIVNTFELGDDSKKIYGRINAGGLIQLTANGTIDAGVTMTVGKDGNEEAGHLGFALSF